MKPGMPPETFLNGSGRQWLISAERLGARCHQRHTNARRKRRSFPVMWFGLYLRHIRDDYRTSGVNVQIVALRPCRSATIWPSGVHAAETRSLAPSPASRVLRPDFRSTSPSGLNQKSAAIIDASITLSERTWPRA